MNESGRTPPATVGELRRRIAVWLAATFDVDGRNGTPELDARLLVGHVLGCDPGEVVLRDTAPINDQVECAVVALARSRADGVPVARILGEKEFWGLPFRLSADTLVPRPDTETLIDAALAALAAQGRHREPLTVLDLGTGSGAILAALLSELPLASGVGIDVAEGAIRTARLNCERLGLGDRVRLLVGNWADSLGCRFDLVVSNPPYIPSATIDTLPVEVREHDPHIALDGGGDGLSAYRALLASLEFSLAADGLAFIEVGINQAKDVCCLAGRYGFRAETHRDMAGIDRIIGLSRSEEKRGLEIGRERDTVRAP